MERDDFNRMLQEVQVIEGAVGYKILNLKTHYRDDGHIHEAIWCNNHGERVLWQHLPLTPHVTYGVNERRYRQIVYSDFTR